MAEADGGREAVVKGVVFAVELAADDGKDDVRVDGIVVGDEETPDCRVGGVGEHVVSESFWTLEDVFQLVEHKVVVSRVPAQPIQKAFPQLFLLGF